MKTKTKKNVDNFEIKLNVSKEIDLFFKTVLKSNKPTIKELEPAIQY